MNNQKCCSMHVRAGSRWSKFVMTLSEAAEFVYFLLRLSPEQPQIEEIKL